MENFEQPAGHGKVLSTLKERHVYFLVMIRATISAEHNLLWEKKSALRLLSQRDNVFWKSAVTYKQSLDFCIFIFCAFLYFAEKKYMIKCFQSFSRNEIANVLAFKFGSTKIYVIQVNIYICI